jgi:hypothetical protein
MKQIQRFLVCLPCVMILAACASGGGGGLSNRYTRDLGRHLVPTLQEARLRVWSKLNWNLQREQVEFQNVYWESEWRGFNPPEGAAVSGPTDARVRIIIRGRRMVEELDGGAQYRVSLDGEYEVSGGVSADWRAAPVPDEAEDVFDQMYSELSLEIRTGVRR